MADEIAQLKQLQAGINAAFESLFQASQSGPGNAGAIAASKQQIAALAQATLGTVIGPAFSILGLSVQPVAYAAVRVAIDLNIFETVNKPTDLDELVQKTDADPVILQRILRAICSIGYLKQTAITQWEPTPLTYAMNNPALRDWLIAHFDDRVSISANFPAWLKNRGYKTTGAADDNVLTETLGVPIWEYYENDPKASAIFDSAMSIQDSFPEHMIPPYPFSEEDIDKTSADPDAVTLVDVGGGFGQAIKAIRSKYPNLKGRFILQDLPKTIKAIDSDQLKKDGIEPMIHDFFNPQVIKGAKYYHLRRVLHDWNDGPSLKILAAIRGAMEDTPSYSRLLIHDSVLPDVGCGFAEAMVDLVMMQVCDGTERTESHWHTLLKAAGFKIVGISRAEAGVTGVIEAVLA